MGGEVAYGVVAHRRGRSEGGAPRLGRRREGGRRRRGSVSRRIRSVALQMDSRYGEEVIVGVGGASGLARIDPGRPCGPGRRSAEEGDGGGSRRFSGKMERREWESGTGAAREGRGRDVSACVCFVSSGRGSSGVGQRRRCGAGEEKTGVQWTRRPRGGGEAMAASIGEGTRAE